MDKNTVRVDYHQRKDLLIVFVCGYALGKESCSIDIANKIAKQIGMKEFPITTYPEKIGLPIREMEKVY